MRKIKIYKFKPQMLIALGVLVASFSALFVSIKQASIMNEQTNIILQQTKITSWPYLNITLQESNINGNLEEYVIRIDNKGNGPAIINGVNIYFSDEPVKNWASFFLKAKKPDSIPTTIGMRTINGQVISSNEKIRIFSAENTDLAEWMSKIDYQIKIEICYKSIFNDYWVVKMEQLKSISKTFEVDQCEFSEHHLFID